MAKLSFQDIVTACNRINGYINKTKIISFDSIDKKLNNKILFKLENLQKTGSFKARGAFNHLLCLKEQNILPEKIVAVTSGNHGTAIAYICSILKIKALIYTSKVTSNFKINAMRNFGAEVVITEKRSQANFLAEEKIKEGYHFIHPSADDLVICGQGTILIETIEQYGEEFDSVFAPCGGGGLVSGIYIASKGYKNIKVFGVEPEIANDAKISVDSGKIFAFSESPNTIADGARTLAITENTFQYLKEISDIITVSEGEISYWTEQLNNLSQEKNIEPTAAMAMAGCAKWIEQNKIKNQKILVVLSGGNV